MPDHQNSHVVSCVYYGQIADLLQLFLKEVYSHSLDSSTMVLMAIFRERTNYSPDNLPVYCIMNQPYSSNGSTIYIIYFEDPLVGELLVKYSIARKESTRDRLLLAQKNPTGFDAQLFAADYVSLDPAKFKAIYPTGWPLFEYFKTHSLPGCIYRLQINNKSVFTSTDSRIEDRMLEKVSSERIVKYEFSEVDLRSQNASDLLMLISRYVDTRSDIKISDYGDSQIFDFTDKHFPVLFTLLYFAFKKERSKSGQYNMNFTVKNLPEAVAAQS
jgi:hypothetical protein